MERTKRISGMSSHLVRIIPLIAVLVLTGCQSRNHCNIVPDNRESDCVNEVTRISRELDKPKYAGIISAIDFHPGDYPIRTTGSRRRFSDSLLNDYLDNLEKVGALVRDRMVSPAMVYEELGFELEKAWCNNDVRDYVKQARNPADQASEANDRFSAFEDLAEYCLARDNKTCPDIDRIQLLPQQ